jgi:hypothetical protein
MKEEWKTIKDFPKYQISNMGRVKRIEHEVHHGNKRHGKELIKKANINTTGYLVIQFLIGKNGKRFDKKRRIYISSYKQKGYLVHRLVAEYFVDNPKGYNLVHHKDGDKKNNVFNNLEWISHKNHHHKLRGKTKDDILIALDIMQKQLDELKKYVIDN